MKLLAGFTFAVISGFTTREKSEEGANDFGLVEDSCDEYFHNQYLWPLTSKKEILALPKGI